MKNSNIISLIMLFALLGAYTQGLNFNPFTLFGLYEDAIKAVIMPPKKSEIKHIIFDLDGVLFTTSKKLYPKIAPYFPLYLLKKWSDKKSIGVKDHYLEVLAQIKGKSTKKSYHKGKPMPQIMIDWQTGEDVYETVMTQIAQMPDLAYAYKKMMLAIAENVFNPAKFIRSRTRITKGIKLLRALKRNGYKVYVLSNWDAQSFPLLKKKYHKIMKLFDGIMISGEAGTLKPEAEIFMKLLNKYDLKAEECLFIDDEQHNVDGAKNVGIRTVKFDHKNISEAIEELESHGVLIEFNKKQRKSKPA